MRPIAPVLLALAFVSPALAKDYPDVASLLAAIRSGEQKLDREVTIERAQLSTPVTHWGYDDPQEYTSWFYVNDAGRDGDGILVSIPNYWSGASPFEEDPQDPSEFEIELPKLERGYVVKVAGRLESRDDGSGGYKLARYDLDHVELIGDGPGEYPGSGSMKAELPVLSQQALPAQAAPSQVSLLESRVLPGEVFVVRAKDVGDRGRVLVDGRRVELLDRRPGLFMVRVPADTGPGDKRVEVENPLAGKSAAVTLEVLAAPEPPAPSIQSASVSGGVLMVRGQNLAGKTVVVKMGNKKLKVLAGGAGQLVADVPAGTTGRVKVIVNGKESNAVNALGMVNLLPGQ